MRLLKVAGQSNDWSLVLLILQLAPTPQCEMRCLSKFALPAHNWVVLHCINIFCEGHHVFSMQPEGQTTVYAPCYAVC